MEPLKVCLCGSTLYIDAFCEANYSETSKGHIVLMPGVFGHSIHKNRTFNKDGLDRLHQAKIDLADEILVIDIGGYIGQSTRREIDYAKALGKPIRYWSERAKVCPVCANALEKHEMPITERDTGGVIATVTLLICPECDHVEDESARDSYGK